MAVMGHEPRPSWICRDAFERARFNDLHVRLLRANTRVLAVVAILIAIAFPTIGDPAALLPSIAGILFFGLIQRRSSSFERPELWVFGALLGAETMIISALWLNGTADTAAMSLMAWPVAGLAGRFHDRALILGTGFAMLLVGGAILVSDPAQVRDDPLSLTLALAALFAVSVVAAAHRDSDIANRGAAILDPLTGMLNRHALATRTAEIEHQSRLTHEPVGVIVADVDHFKHVNDTHGHGAGDAVLRAVAYALRRELRAYDLAYRLGGEEFVVLVLGAQAGSSAEVAERLRSAVERETCSGVRVTMSFGVAATRRGDAFSWSESFARADAALYDAKAAGRNCVRVAGVEIPHPGWAEERDGDGMLVACSAASPS
jgi:diguanylate cyclase (GGDEF)-like protein